MYMDYKRDLWKQLASDEFLREFQTFKQRHKIFRRYPTIDSLSNLLKWGSKQYADKDRVMTILLTELRSSNILYPLLNFLFWDSLIGLYFVCRARVDDHDELFSRIQWDFYQSAMSHDLKRLPRKIDVNVLFNTKKKVTAWVAKKAEEQEAIEEIVRSYEAGLIPPDLSEVHVAPEEMETYLLEMVYRNVITETQYDLILETLVYKRMNQREWAEKRGIPYNTVRNLRYRAEAAIRRCAAQGEEDVE